MGNSDQLELGRRAHARQAWGEAYSHLTAAGLEAPLELVDLERLAVAAYLTGKEEESAVAWTRAHHESLRVDDKPRAGLFAFWLAFSLLNRGELARGGGWLARAQRLLDEAGRDGPEQGYLLLPNALRQIAEGDAATARATFGQVTQIGERFGDPDLTTMGQLGRGRALILLGEIAEGVALLDEAMVAVTAGEVSPIVVGTVYCAAIEACREIFDLRRAQEWTAALSRWCESQPDLVPYRGECLVYRAEILRLHGSWGDAATEAQRACERLAGRPAAGAAFYQLAELHRLRGDFTKAEDAYRQASQWGRGGGSWAELPIRCAGFICVVLPMRPHRRSPSVSGSRSPPTHGGGHEADRRHHGDRSER